jgi:hypothetical protein
MNTVSRFYFFFVLITLLGCSKDDNVSETIDKEVPLEKVILTKVEIIDGTIYVSWNPIKNFNFNWATLRIKGGDTFKEVILSEETLKAQVFNDTESTSSNLNYQLELKKEEESTLSNELNLNSNPITITESYIGFNKLKINYSKHPLYNNFDHFSYEIGYYKRQGQLSKLGGEFTIDYPVIFGDKLRVNTYRHNFITNYETGQIDVNGDTEKSFDVGSNFESAYYNDFTYDSTRNKYLALDVIAMNSSQDYNIYLCVFNSNNLALESSTLVTTTTDTNYLEDLSIDHYSKKIILNLAKKSLILDNNDFSKIKDCDCNDYVTNPGNYKSTYANNVLACQEMDGVVSFFNAETKQLKASIISTDNYFRISNDARYFFLNNQFYELLENDVQLIMASGLSTDSPNMQLIFNTNNNSSIAISKTNYAVQFDFNTKTKKNLDDLIQADQINFNEIKNEYMIGEYHQSFGNYSDASFITLWQEGSNKKRKIEVYDDHTVGSLFKYVNDKILFSRGQYLNQSWLNY